jgi:four helix bundle protein
MTVESSAIISNKPHRNLLAWQKTMDLAVEIYRITRHFPREEAYGITSQLRRAAVSGPSNIAEGAADRTKQQFSNFLSNVIGSLNEIDTQLELALRLEYLTIAEYDQLHRAIDNCLALTYGLRNSLNKKSVNREKTVSSERKQATNNSKQEAVSS